MRLVGALDRPEAAVQGQDAGLVAGAGASGILVGADPLPAFANTDAVLDFTAPEASSPIPSCRRRRASCM